MNMKNHTEMILLWVPFANEPSRTDRITRNVRAGTNTFRSPKNECAREDPIQIQEAVQERETFPDSRFYAYAVTEEENLHPEMVE